MTQLYLLFEEKACRRNATTPGTVTLFILLRVTAAPEQALVVTITYDLLGCQMTMSSCVYFHYITQGKACNLDSCVIWSRERKGFQPALDIYCEGKVCQPAQNCFLFLSYPAWPPSFTDRNTAGPILPSLCDGPASKHLLHARSLFT